MTDLQTILVRISGPDAPGISAGALAILDKLHAQVLDMEQIVIRRRLTLGLLVAVPPNQDALKELLLYGWEQKLEVDFEVVEEESSTRELGHIVTALGSDLTPAKLRTVTQAIAAGGGNLERIVRLSKYPVTSYEFTVSGGDRSSISHKLLEMAGSHPDLDVAVQAEGLARRAKRLVVLDVDSTLVQDEAIDLLADEAGTGAEVADITARAMAGELDFEQSLRRRVALLEGLDDAGIERAWQRMRLTPGARTFMRTLHRLGLTTGIVSGGFTIFTDRLAAELNIGHASANQLEQIDGKLTGRLVGPIIDRAAKAEFLQATADQLGIQIEQTVAVGDGANDLDMLELAGLGIAFNAKAVVREAADTSISVPYLDAILFLLGVRREDVEAADAQG